MTWQLILSDWIFIYFYWINIIKKPQILKSSLWLFPRSIRPTHPTTSLRLISTIATGFEGGHQTDMKLNRVGIHQQLQLTRNFLKSHLYISHHSYTLCLLPFLLISDDEGYDQQYWNRSELGCTFFLLVVLKQLYQSWYEWDGIIFQLIPL